MGGLELNDKIFISDYRQHFGYTVIEIRNTLEVAQYLIRCDNCSDHDSCEVVIESTGATTFGFVKMNSEDTEHECWHKGVYYRKQSDAEIAYLNRSIENCNKDILKSKRSIAKQHIIIADCQRKIREQTKYPTTVRSMNG